MPIRFILMLIICFLVACKGSNINKVDFKRTFEGGVEGQNLALILTHIDSKITGELNYRGSRYMLDGSLSKIGKFEISVSDASGGLNGFLKGKLKNGNVLKATWTEIIGNKDHELDLNLTESSTPVNFNEIYKKTVQWNKQINARDFQLIANAYCDTITFYTELRPKEYCIRLKMKYIEKYRDYHQTIDRSMVITEYKSGIIKSEFNKTMFRNGETRKYPSYLLFRRVGNEIKIVEEGDLLTNANLHKVLNLGEVVRTETLDNYTIREMPAESSVPFYIGIFLLTATTGSGYYLYKRKKKKATNLHEEKRTVIEREVVIEKEVVVEKQIIIEKEVIIEVSSDRNLSESEIKGREFEKCIVKLFPEQYYQLLYWTSDKRIDDIYPKSNENPDLIYGIIEKDLNKVKETNREYSARFAVECKYRTKLYNNRVELCTDKQLKRYQQFGIKNKMDVFIVLGYGGFSSNPDKLFVIPVNKIQRGYLFPNELDQFLRYASTQTSFFYMMGKHLLS